MNERTVRETVRETVAIHVVTRKPKDQVRHGILVEQGIGSLETLGFARPDGTHTVGSLGPVVISGTVVQARQGLARNSLAMCSAQHFRILPTTGSSIRRTPIEGNRGGSSTDVDRLLESIDGRTE